MTDSRFNPQPCPSGKVSVECVGIVCHLGAVTGTGCSSDHPCPLKVLNERGVITFPTMPRSSR